MQKNILITGKPRCGKTTLLSTLIAQLPHKVGMVTNEILVDDKRVGFEIEIQDGQRAILAHIDSPTSHKVARYFVQTENVDEILPSISQFTANDLLYLDEIGEMELGSEAFKSLVLAYLNSDNTCIATLSSIYEDEFTKAIQERDDVILIEIDSDARDEQMVFARQLLKKIEKARRYIADPSLFSFSESEVTLRSEHGTRTLHLTNGSWRCSCDFFADNSICSHSIATKEIVRSL